MTPSKKEMTIAFGSIGALALLCGLIGLIVALTRPSGGPAWTALPPPGPPATMPADLSPTRDGKQKWLIISALPSGSGTIDIEDFSTVRDEARANTESRLALGKPQVDGNTVRYRDWHKGSERVWTVEPSKEVHIAPVNEWKE